MRELANLMERVARLADGIDVTAAMLGLPTSRALHGPVPSVADERRAAAAAHAEAERARLLEVLRATSWNLSRAAARLGIPRNTLRYRMDKLGLGSGSAPLRMAAAPTAEGSPDAGSGRAPSGGGRRPPTALTGITRESGSGCHSVEVRRVTLLGARLVAPRAESGLSEASRTLDLLVEKVRTFGGHVEEFSATGLVAALDLSRSTTLRGTPHRPLSRSEGRDPDPPR